ncbi:hypothetical protein [Labrenzia sp. DG1229]|uniref:hypothetical protein n=1 Tax=Labrenzia sp. DG1229 TaxID=681847 RepID=UPI0005651DA6|nr:hypothetical protein [Labrenzia sp. DG1229]
MSWQSVSVYVPEKHAASSKQVTVTSYGLEDNLAGDVTPVADLKLDFANGSYTGRMTVKKPFGVEREFQMKVALDPDHKGVDGGFLRVIFYYDHEATA